MDSVVTKSAALGASMFAASVLGRDKRRRRLSARAGLDGPPRDKQENLRDTRDNIKSL